MCDIWQEWAGERKNTSNCKGKKGKATCEIRTRDLPLTSTSRCLRSWAATNLAVAGGATCRKDVEGGGGGGGGEGALLDGGWWRLYGGCREGWREGLREGSEKIHPVMYRRNGSVPYGETR